MRRERPSSTRAGEEMETQLTITDFARLAGLKPATIRQFRWRGIIPAPDGYLERVPWWRPETVETWLATRRTSGRPAAVSE